MFRRSTLPAPDVLNIRNDIFVYVLRYFDTTYSGPENQVDSNDG